MQVGRIAVERTAGRLELMRAALHRIGRKCVQLMVKCMRTWRQLLVASAQKLQLARTNARLSCRAARRLLGERMERLVQSLHGGLRHFVDQRLLDGRPADGDAVASSAHSTDGADAAQAGRGALQNGLLLDLRDGGGQLLRPAVHLLSELVDALIERQAVVLQVLLGVVNVGAEVEQRVLSLESGKFVCKEGNSKLLMKF